MINTDLIVVSTESLLSLNAQLAERKTSLDEASEWTRMSPEECKRAVEAINFLIASNTSKVEPTLLKWYRSALYTDRPSPILKRSYDILMIATNMVEEL